MPMPASSISKMRCFENVMKSQNWPKMKIIFNFGPENKIQNSASKIKNHPKSSFKIQNRPEKKIKNSFWAGKENQFSALKSSKSTQKQLKNSLFGLKIDDFGPKSTIFGPFRPISSKSAQICRNRQRSFASASAFGQKLRF